MYEENKNDEHIPCISKIHLPPTILLSRLSYVLGKLSFAESFSFVFMGLIDNIHFKMFNSLFYDDLKT